MTLNLPKAFIGHAWARRARWILIYYVIFSLMVVDNKAVKEHSSFCSETDQEYLAAGGICPSVLIEHKLDFKQLCKCRVIEGHIHIRNVLKTESIEELSFPNLIEIKDFLLFFKVSTNISLSSLFPSLTVIRGADLVGQYAVVIYNVQNIVNLTLPSLISIVRGYVFIKSSLCLTLDHLWTTAVEKGDAENEIGSVSEQNCKECSVVYSQNSKTFIQGNVPKKLGKDCYGNCTKITERCRDPQCLSCKNDGSGDSQCLSCKKFRDDGRCVMECPTSKFKVGHSCVEEKFCRSQNYYLIEDKNECLPPEHNSGPPLCPAGYKADSAEKLCIPCTIDDPCNRSCKNTKIRNVDDSLTVKDCEIIEGNLIIQVEGGDFVKRELEKNLEKIVEVNGYVSLVRMSPSSVTILRNLRKIHGQILTDEGYALVVEDNKNLESLDAWFSTNSTKRLEVVKGKVRFRNNPRLCYQHIVEFLSTNDIVSYRQHISNTSNGFYQNCNNELLKVSVRALETFGSLKVVWESSQSKLFANLSTYYISYKLAYNNLSVAAEDLHTCDTGWTMASVQVKLPPINGIFRHVISGLVPFTRYAVYVRTFTGITHKSNVVYAVTSTYNPSSPTNVKITWNDATSLRVRWAAPTWPNGKIDHYEVTLKRTPQDKQWADGLDFCDAKVQNKLMEIQQRYKIKNEKQRHLNMEISNKTKEKSAAVFSENKIFSTNKRALSEPNKISSTQSELKICQPRKKCFCLERNSEANLLEKGNWKSGKYAAFDNDYFLYRGDERKPFYSNLQRIIPIKWPRPWDDGPFLQFDEIQKNTHHTEQTFHNLRFGFYTVSIKACQKPVSCPGTPVPVGDSHGIPKSQFVRDYRSHMCRLCSLVPGFASNDILTQGAMDTTVDSKSIKFTKDESSSYRVEWNSVQSTPPVVRYWLKFQIQSGDQDEVVTCINAAQHQPKMTAQLSDLPTGNLSLQIQPVTMTTQGQYSSPFYIHLPEERGWSWNDVIFMTSCVIFIPGIFIVIYLLRRNMAETSAQEIKNFIYRISDSDLSAIHLHMIRDRNDLEIYSHKGTLGPGHFGQVFQGHMKSHDPNDPEVIVAVKTPKNPGNKSVIQKFIKEIVVAQSFNHRHLIKLLGVVLGENRSTLYCVMEYMVNRDLKTYLRKAPRNTVAFQQQLSRMALEAASGMTYLESRNLVHRDIAARNCLLDHNFTLKIADFGLTISADGLSLEKGHMDTHILPYKWMAPESIERQDFSSKSDVWSYGVLLWEMSTYGCTPFKDWEKSEIVRFVVEEKGHLVAPQKCSPLFHKLMLRCWSYCQQQRPTFLEILELLLPLLNHNDQKEFKKDIEYGHSLESISLSSHKTAGSDSGFTGRSERSPKDTDSEEFIELPNTEQFSHQFCDYRNQDNGHVSNYEESTRLRKHRIESLFSESNNPFLNNSKFGKILPVHSALKNIKSQRTDRNFIPAGNIPGICRSPGTSKAIFEFPEIQNAQENTVSEISEIPCTFPLLESPSMNFDCNCSNLFPLDIRYSDEKDKSKSSSKPILKPAISNYANAHVINNGYSRYKLNYEQRRRGGHTSLDIPNEHEFTNKFIPSSSYIRSSVCPRQSAFDLRTPLRSLKHTVTLGHAGSAGVLSTSYDTLSKLRGITNNSNESQSGDGINLLRSNHL